MARKGWFVLLGMTGVLVGALMFGLLCGYTQPLVRLSPQGDAVIEVPISQFHIPPQSKIGMVEHVPLLRFLSKDGDQQLPSDIAHALPRVRVLHKSGHKSYNDLRDAIAGGMCHFDT